MKQIAAASYLCLIFSLSAFAQEDVATRCERDMKTVPALTVPGSAFMVEQLSCGQIISTIPLEKGYFRIQLGNRIGYVYAKYVTLPDRERPKSLPLSNKQAFDFPKILFRL